MNPLVTLRPVLFLFIVLSLFSCGKKDSPQHPDRSPLFKDKTWTGTYKIGTFVNEHPHSIRFRSNGTFAWYDATVGSLKGKWSVDKDTVAMKLDDYNNTIRANITTDSQLVNWRSTAAIGYRVTSLKLNENAERPLDGTIWGVDRTTPFIHIIGSGQMRWMNVDKEAGTYHREDGMLRFSRNIMFGGQRLEAKYSMVLLPDGRMYGISGFEMNHTEEPIPIVLYEYKN